MIRRNSYDDTSEPLQQASFTAMKGIDASKAITVPNVVNELENLDVNADGSVSIRKPLIIKRAYTVEYNTEMLKAIKVIKTYVDNISMVVYVSSQEHTFISVESSNNDFSVTRYPIVFKGEFPDYTGSFTISMSPVNPDNLIYDVTGLLDVREATCINTANSTVLGNTRVNIADSRISTRLNNPTLYPSSGELYLPRYLHIEHDSSNNCVLTVKTPEVNSLSNGDVLTLNNNLTLDNPYALRDVYNSSYASIDGIIPYTYCALKDSPTHIASTTSAEAEYTATKSYDAVASDFRDSCRSMYTPGFPLDTEVYIYFMGIPRGGTSVNCIPKMRIYIREEMLGQYSPNSAGSLNGVPFYNVPSRCPDKVKVNYKGINASGAIYTYDEDTKEYVFDEERSSPNCVYTHNRTYLLNTTFTDCAIEYDKSEGCHYVEFFTNDIMPIVNVGPNPEKYDTSESKYSLSLGHTYATDYGNFGARWNGYNNAAGKNSDGSYIENVSYFPEVYRVDFSYSGLSHDKYYSVSGGCGIEAFMDVTFVYENFGEDESVYEFTTSQHFGFNITGKSCNPSYKLQGSYINPSWTLKACTGTVIKDNVNLRKQHPSLKFDVFNTVEPVSAEYVVNAVTESTVHTDTLNIAPIDGGLFNVTFDRPYRKYTTTVSVDAYCSSPLPNSTLKSELTLYNREEGYVKLDVHTVDNMVTSYSKTFSHSVDDKPYVQSRVPTLQLVINNALNLSPMEYHAFSKYTVEEVTEKTVFPKFTVTETCRDVSAATVVLKAFMKFTKDSVALPKYAVWEYSLDGTDWKSWYRLSDNADTNEKFKDYITSIKMTQFKLKDGVHVDAEATEENSDIVYVDKVAIPIRTYYPSDSLFADFTEDGTPTDDVLNSYYTLPNRADVLFLTEFSEMYAKKFFTTPDIAIESVQFRLSICVPTTQTVEGSTLYKQLVSHDYVVPTGPTWVFADAFVDNAVFGDKLYYKNSMYSFNHTGFKNTILCSDPGSFITPLSRLIDVTVSESTNVLSVVPWRDYLIALTSESVHLITLQDEGFRTKIISTYSGITSQDRRTCKAVLNGILFKANSKIYTLYPDTSSGDETILNLSDISKPISHLLDNVHPIGDCFAIGTERAYFIFLPEVAGTTCLKYTYNARTWTVYKFKDVLLTDYHIRRIDDIRLFGTYKGVYTEFYFDKELKDVYPNIAETFGVEYANIPYGDVLTEDALKPVQGERELPDVTPIHFKLDSGQRTDNLSLTKKFQESKFILATLNSKAAANISVDVYVDGNPYKVRLRGDGIAYKTLPTDILTLGEAIVSDDADVYNTLSQVFLKYSGKGKTIRHVISGDSLYNFKLYEVFYRYRPMPNKQ